MVSKSGMLYDDGTTRRAKKSLLQQEYNTLPGPNLEGRDELRSLILEFITSE
jgi:hypothetical protein